jgi:hypothetical protein
LTWFEIIMCVERTRLVTDIYQATIGVRRPTDDQSTEEQMPARRGSFARTLAEDRFQLRTMLIGRIVADPEFGPALSRPFETYVPRLPEPARWWVLADEARFGPLRPTDGLPTGPDPAVAAYVGAVRLVAERFGLDRLVDDRGRELGASLIHDWCRACRRAGRKLPAERLGDGFFEAEYVAEIGEVVAWTEYDLGDIRALDPLVRPVVRVVVVDEWDPWRVSRAEARKELLRLASRKIQEELDRLTADAEAKGYRFPDTARRRGRDLDWLVQLMTKRATVNDLVAHEDREPGSLESEARVGRAIRRMANRAGVSVRGWSLPRG